MAMPIWIETTMTEGSKKHVPVRIVTKKAVDTDLDRENDDVDSRVARLTRLARKVFRRQDKAARWLSRPLPELGGVSPLEMMETPAGARLVESLLLQYADDPLD
jgi:putative toxin-antitoxin system antitoxin component (TIGR02293 family)